MNLRISDLTTFLRKYMLKTHRSRHRGQPDRPSQVQYKQRKLERAYEAGFQDALEWVQEVQTEQADDELEEVEVETEVHPWRADGATSGNHSYAWFKTSQDESHWCLAELDIVEDPVILESKGQPDIPDLAADSPVEDISPDVETLEVVEVPAPSINSPALGDPQHAGTFRTPVMEAVKRLEDTGVAIRCLSYVGAAFREQTTRGCQDHCHTHLSNSCVVNGGVQHADETGARTRQRHRESLSLEQPRCATTPGASWTNCKSGGTDFWARGWPRGRYRSRARTLRQRASSCWWDGSELRRHCKAPESAAICGLRSNTSRTSDIRWWSGKVRTARVQSEGVYARGESQTLR